MSDEELEQKFRGLLMYAGKSAVTTDTVLHALQNVESDSMTLYKSLGM